MLGTSEEKKPEVIIPEAKTSSHQENSHTQNTSIIDAQSRATLEKIYLDLRGEIKHKDQTIQDLSLKL